MTLLTTMDDAGRISIPEELRRKLGLHSGSVMALEHSDSEIKLRPVEVNASDSQDNHTEHANHQPSLFGVLRNPNGRLFLTDEALDAAIDAAWPEATAEEWLEKERRCASFKV